MTDEIIEQLARNYKTFKSLLKTMPQDLIQWKPTQKDWNMLEVLCHLRDEEREDFRLRIRLLLQEDNAPLTPINPNAWVQERQYAEQDFKQVRKSFLKERKASIKWLRKLHDAKWDNAYIHPKYGAMSAKLFLANWLAHDYLHIRQLLKLRYGYLGAHANETLKYAGDW